MHLFHTYCPLLVWSGIAKTFILFPYMLRYMAWSWAHGGNTIKAMGHRKHVVPVDVFAGTESFSISWRIFALSPSLIMLPNTNEVRSFSKLVSEIISICKQHSYWEFPIRKKYKTDEALLNPNTDNDKIRERERPGRVKKKVKSK